MKKYTTYEIENQLGDVCITATIVGKNLVIENHEADWHLSYNFTGNCKVYQPVGDCKNVWIAEPSYSDVCKVQVISTFSASEAVENTFVFRSGAESWEIIGSSVFWSRGGM